MTGALTRSCRLRSNRIAPIPWYAEAMLAHLAPLVISMKVLGVVAGDPHTMRRTFHMLRHELILVMDSHPIL